MRTRNVGSLQVTTPSDREIAMTRVFDAPRRLVFDAHTKPERVRRWLGVFGGWSMVVCEIDLRVGGSFRYVWRNADGRQMGMRGVFREIVPGERIVSTEAFDESWYEGEAVDTVELAEQGGQAGHHPGRPVVHPSSEAGSCQLAHRARPGSRRLGIRTRGEAPRVSDRPDRGHGPSGPGRSRSLLI